MKKILLVNTNQSLSEWEKCLKGIEGILVFTASTGDEALRIHQEERIDLLVTDLEMCDKEGETLSSLISREGTGRHVSVILACEDIPEQLERVSQFGAASITRPVTPSRFHQKVGQIL